MDTKKLDDLVREALSNAFDNGYTFEECTPAEIAEDMCTYDSELENYAVDDVEAAVRRVRSA